MIPAGFNPHAYEPRAEDIKRIGTLDVIVLNGVGHDDFADDIGHVAVIRMQGDADAQAFARVGGSTCLVSLYAVPASCLAWALSVSKSNATALPSAARLPAQACAASRPLADKPV